MVREPRLNHAYMDPAVRLEERVDPDAGKKKRVRGPEELEAGGPISAVPLRTTGVDGPGQTSRVAEGATVPPLKRVS